MCLDSERIAALLDQIGAIDRNFGDALSRLAKDFDYPTILHLLEDAGGIDR